MIYFLTFNTLKLIFTHQRMVRVGESLVMPAKSVFSSFQADTDCVCVKTVGKDTGKSAMVRKEMFSPAILMHSLVSFFILTIQRHDQ